MAVTQGFVQRVVWLPGPTVCAWVGPEQTMAELLTVTPPISVDSAVAQVLTQAMLTGRAVEVSHPDNSASVTGVALPNGDIDAHPLQMEAIEVTQSVQDLAQSVPLVAGKSTVIRVLLSYYNNPPVTVSGEVTVRSAGGGPVVVPSSNVVTLNAADAGNVTLARSDASRSLNFVLPALSTAVGQVEVRLSRVTNTVTAGPLAFGSERRPVVMFQRGAPLRVRLIGLSYQQGNPAVTFVPSNLDFALLLSWLGRAYPVAQVVSSQMVIAATAPVPFGCGDVNAQLAAIRALDVNAGADARTHYYGVVSDGGFFMRGCAAGIPGSPDPTVVASGPTGPASWGWDFDGSYGDWYGGHELGHTFGRLHPGFCGESQDDLNGYPFPAGQLSTTDAGFAGFDVGDPGNNLPMVALPGSQWHDVMTYCNRQWLSAYTYEGIRRRLSAEDSLPSSASLGGAPAAGAGRPDERFVGSPSAVDAAVSVRPAGAAVSVIAQVNLTRRQGEIRYVNAVPSLSPTPASPESPVIVRLTDAKGGPLREHTAPVKLSSELGPGEDKVGLVDVVILADASTSNIELEIGGEVVDTFQVGGAPPRPRSIRLVPTDRQVLRVAADLDGQPDAGHTFSIQVSTDRGQTWQTVAVGLKEPTFTLDRSQFQPGTQALVRVLASNGIATSTTTSEPLTM